MGLFSKEEVIVLKESSDAKDYLEKLEQLLPKTQGELRKRVQKEITITKAGIIGEDNLLFELKNSNMDMIVLQDIYIETKSGLGAQIDFVVITSKYTFLLECKNLYGNIEIDSKGNFIRTMEYGGKRVKEGIYSPITQSERHMAVLKECKSEEKNALMRAAMNITFDSFHKSLVVLANPKTVVNDRYAKKEIKEQVIRADQIIKVIKEINAQSKEMSSSKKEMRVIAEKMLSRNREERKDYFQKYQELAKLQAEEVAEEITVIESEKNAVKVEVGDTKNERVVNESEQLCPRCGSKLVLRTAKKGNNIGQQFYGCSAFPKCRYVMAIEKEEGEE